MKILQSRQAAYRAGRSTTENVFNFKCLAEKAITSSNYECHILMLDMSKAFDTVNRKTLYEDLKNILEEDDLHMVTILLKDVRLQTRCGHTLGDFFITDKGVTQGDCLSPVMFTFYLAKTLKQTPDNTHDHNYAKPNVKSEELLPKHLQDHTYCTKTDSSILIDQQYADDISWISVNNKHKIEHIKQTVPKKLRSRNLIINDSKTEQYEIKRNGENKWKKCKYLGTLLDTNEDIKRRKRLATVAFHKLKFILKSKRTSILLKTRIFTAFITSIFLYNSELWTLNNKLEHNIDVFHRSLLRQMLKINWTHKVTNIELYNKTNQEKWSNIIKTRRLNWYGHLMRLPEETPAKQVLKESARKVKRPAGRPKLTWTKQINNQITELGMTADDAQSLTSDRTAWRAVIGGCAKLTST